MSLARVGLSQEVMEDVESGTTSTSWLPSARPSAPHRDRGAGQRGDPAKEGGVLGIAFHRGDLEPEAADADREEPPVRAYIEHGSPSAGTATRTTSNRFGAQTEGMSASCGWLIGA